MWNTLTSPKLQTPNYVEEESSRDESEQACYMVQGNDSLEIHSENQLEDCASSSDDDHDNMDAYTLNEELSIFCENLLEKYELLKKIYLLNLILFCKRGMRFLMKGTY